MVAILLVAANSCVPVPDAPTGLEAEAGDQQVLLRWDPNAEANLARYIIYRGITGGQLSEIASVPVGLERFTDMGLVNGTSYSYAIAAENDRMGRSPRSSVVTVVPAAPDVPGAAVGVWGESRWDAVVWGR